ncbi:hypothetical protein ACWD4O_39115 [Streptomyces sp. NPDC002623]
MALNHQVQQRAASPDAVPVRPAPTPPYRRPAPASHPIKLIPSSHLAQIPTVLERKCVR